jgi:2-deoxy-D-gluconate 3-dehydrogenase
MSGIKECFSLQGKTAFVTGARTGIGQAIALALAEADARLIIHGHQGDMSETQNLLSQRGTLLDTVLFDLGQPALVKDCCQKMINEYTIDIVVNNAGIIRREPVATYSERDWHDVLNVNLNSLFVISQLLARPMMERRSGKIINIASLLSFQGGIYVPAYAASKHAVVGLTKAMANELAPYGIQVNAIAPGYIVTNNTQALREDPDRSHSILSRIPAGRWGQPEDIAGAAVFLASRLSDYVNGHTLVVDGGWMAR